MVHPFGRCSGLGRYVPTCGVKHAANRTNNIIQQSWRQLPLLKEIFSGCTYHVSSAIVVRSLAGEVLALVPFYMCGSLLHRSRYSQVIGMLDKMCVVRIVQKERCALTPPVETATPKS